MKKTDELDKRYVAFLRGINMFGQQPIKMQEINHSLESIGYKNVKSVLASGNLLFDAKGKENFQLKEEIETILEKRFERSISAFIRSLDELNILLQNRPFGDVEVTSTTKPLVTFLEYPLNMSVEPYLSKKDNFELIGNTKTEVFSVAYFPAGKPSSRVMAYIEKKFGKQTTTRSLGTLMKIVKKGLSE